MREILFRGKDFSGVINHSWCFGSLDTTEKDRAVIIYPDRFGNKCRVFVNPDTIGQYTGLTDKNGVKIFEGDIIKTKKYGKIIGHSNVNDFDIFVVIYEPAMFRLENTHRAFSLVEKCGKGIEYEVIGNIHDNPEIL